MVSDRQVAHTPSPHQDICSEHQERAGDIPGEGEEQGGVVVLSSLRASVRDEQGRPLPCRGGRHGAAGDAGAGLEQPLQTGLAEQGGTTALAGAQH